MCPELHDGERTPGQPGLNRRVGKRGPSTVVPKTVDEIELRRYLLGTLSEKEEARHEELLLTEESYFEQLVLAEDELIDEYLRGKMTERDKERMEQHFLKSANHQERLELGRALSR